MQRSLDEGFCKVGLHRVSELPRNYKFSFSSVFFPFCSLHFSESVHSNICLILSPLWPNSSTSLVTTLRSGDNGPIVTLFFFFTPFQKTLKIQQKALPLFWKDYLKFELLCDVTKSSAELATLPARCLFCLQGAVCFVPSAEKWWRVQQSFGFSRNLTTESC